MYVYITREEQIFGAVGWICSGPHRRVRRRKGKCVYRRDRAVTRAYEILLCRLTVVGRELADCWVFIYFIHTDGWRNRLRVSSVSLFSPLSDPTKIITAAAQNHIHTYINILCTHGERKRRFRTSVRPPVQGRGMCTKLKTTHAATHRKWQRQRGAKQKGSGKRRSAPASFKFCFL